MMAYINKSQSFGTIMKVKRSQHKLIDNLKTEIKELKAENECLRMCLTATSSPEEQAAFSELKLRDEKKQLQEELKNLYEEVKRTQSYLTGAGDANASDYFRNINRELTIRNEDLEQKLKQYELKGLAIVTESLNDSARIEELQSMVSELKKTNYDLQQKLKVALKIYQDSIIVEEKVKILNNKVEMQKSEREIIQITIAKQKQTQNDLIDRLEECVSSTCTEKYDLEAEIHKLKMKISELDEENKHLEYQLTLYKDINGDRKEWMKKISFLESEKHCLENLVNKLNREQDDLTDRLQRKIRDTTIQEIELQSEIARQQAKVKGLETVINDLSKKLERTKKKLTIEHLVARKDSGLELDIVHLEFEKKALQDEKDYLTEENRKFVLQIKDLRKELQIIQEDKRNILTDAYNDYKKTFYKDLGYPYRDRDTDDDLDDDDTENETAKINKKLESCIDYIDSK